MVILKRYIVGIVGFLVALGARAQSIDVAYHLDWHEPYREQISEDYAIVYLYFENAQLSTGTNNPAPYFCKYIPVESMQSTVNLQVSNQKWQTLTANELQYIDKELITADTLQPQFTLIENRKQAELQVYFFPFRKIGTQYQKLLSFDLQGIITPSPLGTGKKPYRKGTTTTSILSSGDFYKVALSQTGIYQITYSDMQSLGINMNNLSFNNIALFGNGGDRLPESTSTPVFDDLQEVAIDVVDKNGNGQFDAEDYFLFYGMGIIAWNEKYYTADCQFEHDMNFYTKETYYFLTTTPGVGLKKRISQISSLTQSATHTVTTYYYRNVIEKEINNTHLTSRIWVGDNMANVPRVEYKMSAAGILQSANLYLKMQVLSLYSSTFSVSLNGNSNVYTLNTGQGLISATYTQFYPKSDELTFTVDYTARQGGAIGWIDFLEVHGKAALGQYAGQIGFRNPEIVGTGNVAQYQFDTKGKNTQIWDVTDRHNCLKINGNTSANTLSFRLSADSLREFIAFDGTSFLKTTPVGKIANQNLHGLQYADLVIITHPSLLGYAEKLANFRRTNDNMSVHVVTTSQVYNEFGSGAMDIGAIRNFLKMFYDRASNASEIPQNALLFGKASFDFRNIYGKDTCIIPFYQGTAALDMDNDLATDNFFGKLAAGKGNNANGSMDMGIGRLSASNTYIADILVQKSINYAAKNNLVPASESSVSNLGSWRNIVAFTADDNDDGYHIDDPESVIKNSALATNNYINIDKMYCDIFKKEFASNGTRYPEVNAAINRRINNGCLMFSYFGHGGDNGWAHERILQRSDINSWTNKYCLPFLFTGCCTFNYYDRLDGVSPAEEALFKSNGGAIALVTSTRNTTSGGNRALCTALMNHAFEKVNGKYLTLGEMHRAAQCDYNYNTHVLMGDPSATLAHPQFNVITDSINGKPYTLNTDTINSLQKVTVSGYIADDNNLIMSNLNGWVYPSVYDKPDSMQTLPNNPGRDARTIAVQKNLLFRGKIKITNGRFNFTFITPKDMNFTYGIGKISYYATDEQTVDATGFTLINTGGIYDTIINDDIGPDIQLWLNDEQFVSGGITTASPVLLARISDSSGINTAGAGIGHDIVAILDNNTATPYTLNDFFEYDSNSYTSGKLTYALSMLSVGHHTLTLRAWDIVNNVSEKTIDFEVVDNTELQLAHVLNYPNPFTTSTYFSFEHNHPNSLMHILLQIYTISGKLVKTIISDQQTEGFRSDPIFWDGRDDFGDKLARGVYVYKLKVVIDKNTFAEKIEKIVIL